MNSENNKKKKRGLLILLAVIMLVFGAVYTGYYFYTEYESRQQQTELTATETETVSGVQQGKKNPVDFDSLWEQNEEIYSWIKVPGTKVDYPIVQSAVSDEFYLKHSALDRSWIASGAIYTEFCNSMEWDDRVTVVYGHNGYSDTMFTTLHKFESAEFLKKHPNFYIYTPDSKLTYKIVSAFKYDDRHIMNSFDFQNNSVFESFLELIQNPVNSTNKTVAENLGRKLNLDDRIVVLSTCITNQKNSRYLVCGVLVENEKTD